MTHYATRRTRFFLSLALACAATLLPGQRAGAEPPYSEREDVGEFIAQMQTRHGWDAAALRRLFAQVKPQAGAIKAIMPPKDPAAVKSWQAYRARYIEPKRIGLGLDFWDENRLALEAAEREFGVPQQIVLAILGVETIYGRHMGSFPTLATLTTLAFDYPPRADLFRSELEAFLLLARERGASPLVGRGSYAGAIGMPQFLPSSIRRYAIDFDGDGRIDIAGSAADAIGSIANFLQAQGWQRDGVIAVPARIVGERIGEVADGAVVPRWTPAQLADYGVLPDTAVPGDMPCAVVDLVTPDQPTEYWLGFQNFYAITRYNRSSFYAMTVYQLSEKLRAARQGLLASRQAAAQGN